MRCWVLALCAACSSTPAAKMELEGPRSGLPRDTAVRDLSPADRQTLCQWWGQTVGEGRMQSCSACTGDACTDWDVKVSTDQECVAWMATLSCAATVDDAESCAFAQQPDLCASPAACDPFTGC